MTMYEDWITYSTTMLLLACIFYNNDNVRRMDGILYYDDNLRRLDNVLYNDDNVRKFDNIFYYNDNDRRLDNILYYDDNVRRLYNNSLSSLVGVRGVRVQYYMRNHVDVCTCSIKKIEACNGTLIYFLYKRKRERYRFRYESTCFRDIK